MLPRAQSHIRRHGGSFWAWRRESPVTALRWWRICMLGAFWSLLLASDGFGQSLIWARPAGGLTLDAANAVRTDAEGNVYLAGTFAKCQGCAGAGATFGTGEPNEITLTSIDDSEDMFLAKYDSSGALLWARGAGGTFDDQAYGVSVDVAGNVYLTGRLQSGFAQFGNGVTLSTTGAFLAKYDSNGTALWASGLHSEGIAFAVATDALGVSHITGFVGHNFGASSLITVWQVGPDGSLLWARQATGQYFGHGTGISLDASGNVYVTGLLSQGSATFGAGSPNEATLTDINGAANEMFLAKYDAAGSFLWARQSADVVGYLAYGSSISTDSSGNSHIVGVGPTILGLGELNETAVTDVFVAKYDTAGQLLWARSITGNGAVAEARSLVIDTAGNSFITGYFSSSITFGPDEANPTTVLSVGGFFGGDIFIAKYEAAGEFLWARQAGGSGTTNGQVEMGLGISLDSAGDAYVVGVFSGATTFGAGEANGTVLASSSILDWDVFVAKYDGGVMTPPDTTPPVLTLPVRIETDADSPAGAAVIWAIGVTDDTDPNPTYNCTPSSGAVFPIGTTTVTCSASDASGNMAPGTFEVHVRGASEQTSNLINLVEALNLQQGISNSLDAKLQNIQAALAAAQAGDGPSACNMLNAFVNEVEAQAEQKLTVNQTLDLISAARRIQAVLGC